MRNESRGRVRAVTFLALTIANATLLAVAVVSYRYVTHLESRVQALEIGMTDRPLTRIMLANGGIRTTFRRPDESAQDYAQRVRDLASGDAPADHLCTTLTGCQPGGTTTIEHCTPYNGPEPSPQVVADHEADVAALCETLECTDCGA
jgi:hypothetical protein